MSVPVKIVVQNSDKKLVVASLVPEGFAVSKEDPVLMNLVSQAVQQFGADPEDVDVKINFVW